MGNITLDPSVERSLREAHNALALRGELLSPEKLSVAQAAFRSRFGPERLHSLDGPTLLQAMHTHGNKESLVYWLEYKNDEEFPGAKLGSIAGGSAFKFRIFRRDGTEQWVTGRPQDEQPISEDEAINIARQHRDQLLAGVALIEALPAGADDPTYLTLQGDLQQQAPDISGLAWAHMYWSLLFPEKLDNFQSEDWQRHNLIRLFETPPEHKGLYVCAGRFVRLAGQLGWPMNHLTAACVERNGAPVHYWRIGTDVGNAGNIWPAMRSGRYIAIGWDMLGDLDAISVPQGQRLRDVLKQQLASIYPGDLRTASKKAGEIASFYKAIKENDVVLACEGMRVLGVGRVRSPYRFETTPPAAAPHRREVEWDSTVPWRLPSREGLLTTVCKMGDYPENLIEAERALLANEHNPTPDPSTTVMPPLRLSGIPGRLQMILERKGQAILYGPPGTGKTYWARQTAFDLAALSAFGRPFAELTALEREAVEGTAQNPGLVRCCTFHPAYGYEDFMEGFRPEVSVANQLVFERRNGIFKQLCDDACREDNGRKFFLLVDEINRGDIPRIFGELLTLLEMDKRGVEVTLPLSGEHFSVPANVCVIGTMNTADRSIALLDTALRRRFGFIELLPDTSVFGTASVGGDIPLGPWLAALNDRLRQFLGRDARNLQIGHAYLLENGRPVADFPRFARVLAEDIVPLLEEYCYEDYGTLARILGSGLVDEPRQRVREELFAPSKRTELVQALIEPAPGITTAPEAQDSAVEEPELGESEEET